MNSKSILLVRGSFHRISQTQLFVKSVISSQCTKVIAYHITVMSTNAVQCVNKFNITGPGLSSSAFTTLIPTMDVPAIVTDKRTNKPDRRDYHRRGNGQNTRERTMRRMCHMAVNMRHSSGIENSPESTWWVDVERREDGCSRIQAQIHLGRYIL
jgi:hypothetical protein